MDMETGAWAGDLPDVRVREVATAHAVDAEEGRLAWSATVVALGDLLEATRALGTTALDGATAMVAEDDVRLVATLCAALQDVRRELAQTEAALVRVIGQDGTATNGTLPDGRLYEVRRGAVRRAWSHGAWQADVRTAVMRRAGVVADLVDPDTGEAVNLHTLISEVQAAHGSTAPRTTSLKALGLDPDNYCESAPGVFSLTVSSPSENS